MDGIFSKCPYLVVRIPGSSNYRGEILRRNVQQVSRNSFMRNLLTALQHHGNRKVRRKTFLPRFQTFSTAHRQIFLELRFRTLVWQKNSAGIAPTNALMYATVRSARTKLFFRNRNFFFSLIKECVFLFAPMRPSESPQFCRFFSLPTAAKLFAS